MLLLNQIRTALGRHDVNRKGFKTERKIIVIESDDWGAIHMPSRKVYEKLFSKGFPVDTCVYARNDSLASAEDLDILFNVLTGIRDTNGKHPVVTANCIVANPDFEKIKESEYETYHYEPISETFNKYSLHKNVLSIWKKGLTKNIFYPQFHGREHVNAIYWLTELRKGNTSYNEVFNFGTWVSGKARIGKLNPQAALDTFAKDHFCFHQEYLTEGLKLFKELFGYNSKSYIPTNFIIDESLFPILQKHGVDYMQGMKYHKNPFLNNDKHTMHRRYMGYKNRVGQMNLVRNCTFEPTQMPEAFDSVGSCLKDISNAFAWKKPAIISSHRLNYVGFIRPENRDRNIVMLKELLSKIVQKWPDVEFMHSAQLGKTLRD